MKYGFREIYVFIVVLLFSACVPNGSSQTGQTDGWVTGSTDSGVTDVTGTAGLDQEESSFLTLINAYRAQNGAPALQVSAVLTQASDWMSTDMANKNYFSHTDSEGRDPFARMMDFGYPGGGYSGENIAAGNASAQDTFTQWKNSPGHNANMLDANYRVIGIARAYSAASSYGWYWTTDFGSEGATQ